MMANSPADILVELEQAVETCPLDRCGRILAGIVQLLTGSCDRSQEVLAHVVDGVLLRLTERVEARALAELSTTLAELKVAPPETLRRLAAHNDPDVACPVLLKSQMLGSSDLAAVAASGGERQQRAIAARDDIEPVVTEALVQRGGPICLALIKNPGTKFSDAAYAALIAKAEEDGEIAKALVLRPGTPDLVVRKLLSAPPGQKASAKPNASAAPPAQTAAPARPCPADYAGARPEIVALNRVGKLNDSTVNRFAIRGETASLFTALSVLSGAPIEVVERIMADGDCEGLVMACRASRLNWATTLAILSNRNGTRLSFAERERAHHIYETLLLSTSQWTVRWGEIAASAKANGR
ncbi:DUF2336 domain-containing protein [Bradyrhizobium arachidis]|uniref:DUF2336 domain-containing protein n=1 Tax=Bradyrhizobium arachidis TaxID=858423 RepID=A0AAE7TH18_9BRAD|nr:DUF2336 domain-containing protein [Bradyrhizobium arachidis]QOZ68842.1 DUF2336 domain-containing protein [Bradyrhizobium arachidis]SFV19288.1 Uncharacterized conserved protein, DUF2336 family [Bradyrhizobium arachidis]